MKLHGLRLSTFAVVFSVLISTFPCSRSWAQASGQPPQSQKSDDDRMMPKSMSRSIEFGVGAGFLVGIAAISDFKKNIQQNLDVQNIFRGISYGLYGGILMGLYLTYGVSDEEPPPPASPADPQNPTQNQGAPPFGDKIDSRSVSSIRWQIGITPYIESGQLSGGLISLRLVQF